MQHRAVTLALGGALELRHAEGRALGVRASTHPWDDAPAALVVAVES